MYDKEWESGRELESQEDTDWEDVVSHSKKKERRKHQNTLSGVVTRTRAKAACGATKLSQGRRSDKWQREHESFHDIADGVQKTILEILQSPGKI